MSTIIEREFKCSGRAFGSSSALRGQDLFNYWDKTDCIGTFTDILYTTGSSFDYNPVQLDRVQVDAQDLFESYSATNIITDDVNDPKYNSFQNTIHTMCKTVPGMCDKALVDFCTPISRTSISKSPILTNFCGCYTNEDPAYVGRINKECDPLCHRIGTVQLADARTGKLKRCESTVCVIDDVTINLDKQSSGSISFQQICPSCSKDNPCQCIISGISINKTMDTVGLNSDSFQQYCGKPEQSTCLHINADNTVTPVPCSQVIPEKPDYNRGIPLIIFIIIAIIVIIIILILLATKTSRRTYIVS